MSQMNKSNPTREYVNDVLDTTVDDGTLPPQLRDLLVNDFPLANLNGADRQYFRLYSENVGLMTDEAYPPKESYAQGRSVAPATATPTTTPTHATRSPASRPRRRYWTTSHGRVELSAAGSRTSLASHPDVQGGG
jgi:hypothetical protein